MSAETWNCPKCGEEVEAQFDACWKCGTNSDVPLEHFAEETSPASPEQTMAQILRPQKDKKETWSDLTRQNGENAAAPHP